MLYLLPAWMRLLRKIAWGLIEIGRVCFTASAKKRISPYISEVPSEQLLRRGQVFGTKARM